MKIQFSLAVLFLGATALLGQRPQGDAKGPVTQYIPFEQYSQQDNERILKMYESLRVADVTDGLDAIGLQDVGIVSADIKALWRDTENFTHQIRGIAVTARYMPTNKREAKLTDEAIGRWYRELTSESFVDVLFPGSILVIDGDEDNDSRSIGSSNIKKWCQKGAVGVITSGGVGDTDEIIHQKIPLYYRRLGRGLRPGRNELESVNRPVTIGGVLVRPGDVIVADGDGVVVVPREHAEAVAKAAMPFLDNIGLDRLKKKQQQK